jgi:hypothetical protein
MNCHSLLKNIYKQKKIKNISVDSMTDMFFYTEICIIQWIIFEDFSKKYSMGNFFLRKKMI